ncbi:MAG: TonB-dependent hemoglobin/transferrin/lactoferrin family receptor [Pseudomonadota bacterium]
MLFNHVLSFRPRISAVTALVLVVGGFSVQAQEKRADENVNASDVLEQVIVIGTRTPRRLYEAAESISVVDVSEFEKFQAQSLSEVLKGAPGVEFTAGPRAIAQEPVIRGLGGNRILITVDGVRQNFDSGHKGRVFVETELLKAVEVLRGPGSAVYGSGALGGVIAMKTKDGADFLDRGQSLGARVKTGYTDADNQQSGTGIVAARSDFMGGLDLLLSGTRRASEDVRLGNGEVLDDSAQDVWAGLVKLGWAPTLTTRVQYSRQAHFIAGEVPAQADERTSPTAVLTDRETEVEIDRVVVSHGDLSGWFNPELSVYNSAQILREKRIGTNGRLDIINFDTQGAEFHNVTLFDGPWGEHRLVYGIEHYEDETRSTRGGGPNLAFPDATATFTGSYVQDEWRVNDRWTTVLGLRYDQYETQSDGATVIDNSERDISEWSPRASVVFAQTDRLSWTGSYSQAFRAPTFQELYISGVHFGANNFTPNPNLTPEKLDRGVEVGLRYFLSDFRDTDHRFSVRANLFHNRFSNFIDSIITTTITSFDNISKAETRGSELELSYQMPERGWDISAGVSYLKGDNLTDDVPLRGISGHNLKLTVQKYFDGVDLQLGARSVFYARQGRLPGDQPDTAGYATHDLFGVWRPQFTDNDITVTFGIDNVADKNFTSHLSSLPAPGRNVKVTLAAGF